MAKISNKLEYILQTPVNAEAYWLVTDPATGETEHIRVADVIDGGIVVSDTNNVWRIITTEFSSNYGSVSEAINNTQGLLAPVDPSLDGFDVQSHELIIFKVPRREVAGNSIFIYYDYYQHMVGKGNFGLGGDVVLTDDDLFFIRTTEATEITSGENLPPVLYTIYEEDYLTPENPVNSVVVAGGFPITDDADYYFEIHEIDADGRTITGNMALYRWIGSAGTYGTASGFTTAVSGDFVAVEIDDNNNTIQKILVPNRIVGAVIQEGTAIANIADAVNNSFRGIIIIGDNMIQSFEAVRVIVGIGDQKTVTFVTEKYFYTKGKATISSDSIEEDFILYETTSVTNTIGTTIDALPQIETIYGNDVDAPQEGVNNSDTLFNIDGSKDFYFVMYDNNTTAKVFKTYRFTGAVTGTGTYGFGGAKTAVLGDFLLITSLTGEQQIITKTSQLKNDGEGNGFGYAVEARVNDVGNVSTPQVINWSLFETWDYVMTANVTFTESNTPVAGKSKTITVYISGAFTPTLPVSWTIKSGVYDPSEDNQFVVEWVKSGKVWVHINS